MRVYDFSMYNGEKEILEIKLNTLDKYVNFFIVGSSKFSHSGIEKGLNEIPPDLMEKFGHKIIFYEIPYTYDPNPWVFETFSREYIYNQIKNRLNSEDILHIADLDEIPKLEFFTQAIKNLIKPVTFYGSAFTFCFDLYSHESANGILIKAGWKKDISLTWFRNNRTNYQQKIFHIIKDSSYHFTSIGTPEQIAKKMSYFAHCNDTPFKGDVRNPEHIKTLIKNKCGFDINTPNKLKKIELNHNTTLPYLVDNQDKFKHLLYSNYE